MGTYVAAGSSDGATTESGSVEYGTAGGPRRIALVGPYPPPVGGIAVHVQRLGLLLSRNYDIVVLDPYGKRDSTVPPWVRSVGPLSVRALWALARAIRDERAELFHFHVSSMRRFSLAGAVLLRLMPRGACSVLTIHSGRFVGEYMASGPLSRAAVRNVVGSFDGVIAVNNDIALLLRSFGVRANRIAVVPAFLPPGLPVPGEMTRSMAALRKGAPKTLVMSGYARRDYSFETVLRVVKNDPVLNASCCIVICLYSQYDREYLKELESLVSGMLNVVLLKDLTPSSFSEVLASGDIFVRPTRVDGDAVAIREAGYFKKQVIASDCVERPKGSLIFRVGDEKDFKEKMIVALADPVAGRIEDVGESMGRALADFYRAIVNAKR